MADNGTALADTGVESASGVGRSRRVGPLRRGLTEPESIFQRVLKSQVLIPSLPCTRGGNLSPRRTPPSNRYTRYKLSHSSSHTRSFSPTRRASRIFFSRAFYNQPPIGINLRRAHASEHALLIGPTHLGDEKSEPFKIFPRIIICIERSGSSRAGDRPA